MPEDPQSKQIIVAGCFMLGMIGLALSNLYGVLLAAFSFAIIVWMVAPWRWEWPTREERIETYAQSIENEETNGGLLDPYMWEDLGRWWRSHCRDAAPLLLILVAVVLYLGFRCFHR